MEVVIAQVKFWVQSWSDHWRVDSKSNSDEVEVYIVAEAGFCPRVNQICSLVVPSTGENKSLVWWSCVYFCGIRNKYAAGGYLTKLK